MKKLICIVTLLALLCACVPALAEDGSSASDFVPTLTYAMNYSAESWFSSDFNRAMLTILLALDLGSAVPDLDVGTWLGNTTFVGKDGYTLVIIGHTDTQVLAVTFCPPLCSASYIVDDLELSSSLADIETVASNTCADGYYQNNQTTILQCLKELNDMVSD